MVSTKIREMSEEEIKLKNEKIMLEAKILYFRAKIKDLLNNMDIDEVTSMLQSYDILFGIEALKYGTTE